MCPASTLSTRAESSPAWLPASRVLRSLVLAAAGVILGALVAVALPIGIAAALNHDPLHQGFYFEAVEVLLIVLPLLIAAAFFALSWRGKLAVLGRAAAALTMLSAVALVMVLL